MSKITSVYFEYIYWYVYDPDLEFERARTPD